MKLKFLAPMIGATMILSGGIAAAQTTSTGAVGSGTATASDKGATASGGAMGGTISKSAQERRKVGKRDRAARNSDQHGADVGVRAPTANTATTYGAGSVYTDRNSTSAGVTSGGLATGTGSQSTSSTVDAYGETGRTGTSSDIYGNSTATSGARQ